MGVKYDEAMKYCTDFVDYRTGMTVFQPRLILDDGERLLYRTKQQYLWMNSDQCLDMLREDVAVFPVVYNSITLASDVGRAALSASKIVPVIDKETCCSREEYDEMLGELEQASILIEALQMSLAAYRAGDSTLLGSDEVRKAWLK